MESGKIAEETRPKTKDTPSIRTPETRPGKRILFMRGDFVLQCINSLIRP